MSEDPYEDQYQATEAIRDRIDEEKQTQPDPIVIDLEAVEVPDTPIVAKVTTKTITWHGDTWQIRAKAGAAFFDAYENDKLMSAAKSLLGPVQYKKLLELDPDMDGVDGQDGIDTFFVACAKAWSVKPKN